MRRWLLLLPKQVMLMLLVRGRNMQLPLLLGAAVVSVTVIVMMAAAALLILAGVILVMRQVRCRRRSRWGNCGSNADCDGLLLQTAHNRAANLDRLHRRRSCPAAGAAEVLQSMPSPRCRRRIAIMAALLMGVHAVWPRIPVDRSVLLLMLLLLLLLIVGISDRSLRKLRVRVRLWMRLIWEASGRC